MIPSKRPNRELAERIRQIANRQLDIAKQLDKLTELKGKMTDHYNQHKEKPWVLRYTADGISFLGEVNAPSDIIADSIHAAIAGAKSRLVAELETMPEISIVDR